MLIAETIERQRAPECPAQPDIAKATPALQAHQVQPHRDRLVRRGGFEHLIRLGAPGDLERPGPRPGASLGVEFAELRHRLLHDFATVADGAHQTPIGVRLPVLANRRVP